MITTNLTNTWKRPTSMTRFVKKGPWKQIGADLVRTKPPFIVTANNESYSGFTPLEKLLREHYERLPKPRATAFRFWKLKSKMLVAEDHDKLAPRAKPKSKARSLSDEERRANNRAAQKAREKARSKRSLLPKPVEFRRVRRKR